MSGDARRSAFLRVRILDINRKRAKTGVLSFGSELLERLLIGSKQHQLSQARDGTAKINEPKKSPRSLKFLQHRFLFDRGGEKIGRAHSDVSTTKAREGQRVEAEGVGRSRTVRNGFEAGRADLNRRGEHGFGMTFSKNWVAPFSSG